LIVKHFIFSGHTPHLSAIGVDNNKVLTLILAKSRSVTSTFLIRIRDDRFPQLDVYNRHNFRPPIYFSNNLFSIRSTSKRKQYKR
ncbi:6302_t:CDS:2, partial [Funneliformis mosseae]